MFSAGDTFGPFCLTRLLGKGAFGSTWLAERPGIVRVPVAVKVLHKQDASQALAKEAAILLKLAHPHIVPVVEADEYTWRGENYFALVMTYEGGGDLRNRLLPQGLPLYDAIRYAAGILDAPAYAHSKKVFHRDVKPENVFLRGGHAVLGDFGLAADIDLRSVVEGVGGTAPYIAPEVWDRGESGAPADIWSFGVMLYEMLAGSRPFPSHNLFALQHAVMHLEPRPMPDALPVMLIRVISAALTKQPRDRPTASGLLGILGPSATPSIAPAFVIDQVDAKTSDKTDGVSPRLDFAPAVPWDRRVQLQLAAQREPELSNRLNEWKGRLLGPFRINSVTGLGGQAIVLSARRTDNDELVAIKFPRLPYTSPAKFGSAEVRTARDRLRQGWEQASALFEAGLTTLPRPIDRVTAPNPLHISQRQEWIREEEVYYVEEWIEGLTIDELGALVHSNANWRRHLERIAWTIACEMFVFFDTLARAKPPRIYVDVAPRNFMLDRAWRLRVVDAAAIATVDHVPEQPPVTPNYLDLGNALAWQEKRAIQISSASVLHGMGRVLYRLIANRLPLIRIELELNEPIWEQYPKLQALVNELIAPNVDALAIARLLSTWKEQS